MALQLADIIGRALRESAVRKRHPFYSAGFYIREDELLQSARFWADGDELSPEDVRHFIETAGGQRLGGLLRRPQYFLPAQIYRQLRAR